MQKYLAYKDDKSDKFWKIEVSEASHIITYGRTGSKGNSKTKEFDSEEEALKDAEKLIKSKIKKGYKEVGETNSESSTTETDAGNRKIVYLKLADYDFDVEHLDHLLKSYAIPKKHAFDEEGAIAIVIEADIPKYLLIIGEADMEEFDERYKTTNWEEEESLEDFLCDFEGYDIEDAEKIKEYPNVIEEYYFITDTKGPHKLCGATPEELKLPNDALKYPLIYLGFVGQSDPQFAWLPFDKLHLFCPVHATFGTIYVDYTDPLNPSILETVRMEDSEMKLNEESFASYKEISYKSIDRAAFKKLEEKDEDDEIEALGTTMPWWIQGIQIPICPKTGEELKFLLMFKSHKDLPAIDKHNYTGDTLKHCNKLDFWGDGYLYVFFNPQSKVAAYIIQNS